MSWFFYRFDPRKFITILNKTIWGNICWVHFFQGWRVATPSQWKVSSANSTSGQSHTLVLGSNGEVHDGCCENSIWKKFGKPTWKTKYLLKFGFLGVGFWGPIASWQGVWKPRDGPWVKMCVSYWKKWGGTCFSLQALALKFWRTSRGLIPKLGEQNLRKRGACQVSNLKHSVYLGNIGDEVLPSYVGIIEINHFRDPHFTTSKISWKVREFVRGSNVFMIPPPGWKECSSSTIYCLFTILVGPGYNQITVKLFAHRIHGSGIFSYIGWFLCPKNPDPSQILQDWWSKNPISRS